MLLQYLRAEGKTEYEKLISLLVGFIFENKFVMFEQTNNNIQVSEQICSIS